ncbi:MAG: hypothetical protein CM1200mP2_44950 [Planctomycetaceae bacterium]|nr:MAG: hypothetical protein CM1200mP2_44950 [Planctomycetaceae bacterium]
MAKRSRSTSWARFSEVMSIRRSATGQRSAEIRSSRATRPAPGGHRCQRQILGIGRLGPQQHVITANPVDCGTAHRQPRRSFQRLDDRHGRRLGPVGHRSPPGTWTRSHPRSPLLGDDVFFEVTSEFTDRRANRVQPQPVWLGTHPNVPEHVPSHVGHERFTVSPSASVWIHWCRSLQETAAVLTVEYQPPPAEASKNVAAWTTSTSPPSPPATDPRRHRRTGTIATSSTSTWPTAPPSPILTIASRARAGTTTAWRVRTHSSATVHSPPVARRSVGE